MAGRDDPRMTVRIDRVEHARFVQRAGRLPKLDSRRRTPGAVVAALVSHANGLTMAELEAIVSAWDGRVRAARAADCSPPGSARAGADSSPAPARPPQPQTILAIVTERLGNQSLAMRSIRLGKVRIDGVTQMDPGRSVLDADSVSVDV